MPEITGIIGAQPAVPTLGMAEAKTRFERVMVSFVQAIVSQFVVVLFLDGNQIIMYNIILIFS